MSLAAWNCRGLGSDSTVGKLKWFVKKYRPDVLFLSEMKIKYKRAQRFMWSLGYTGSLGVSSIVQSGGLILYWKQPFSVSLRGCNSCCIDVEILFDSEMP
jgi:exonuclease III